MSIWRSIFLFLTTGVGASPAPKEGPAPAPAATAQPPKPEPVALAPAKPPAMPPKPIPVKVIGDPLSPAEEFEVCVAEVFSHEGGLVDNASDPGGITNYGISLRAASGMGMIADVDGDKDVDKYDIINMTIPVARAIYRALYWNVVRGDDLPPGVNLAVFDWGVNAGPGRAARGLQQSLVSMGIKVAIDGAIGPATLAGVNRARSTGRSVILIDRICERRMAHWKSLKTWPVFGLGWSRRLNSVRQKAIAMAKDAA